MKVKPYVDSEGLHIGITFKCPGCGDNHSLPTDWVPEGQQKSPYYTAGSKWHFNGNLDSPTISPSILVRSGHYAYDDHQKAIEKGCWCNLNERFPEHAKEGIEWRCYLCHSFVRNGNIEFLNDCSHKLSGQTIPLPDL